MHHFSRITFAVICLLLMSFATHAQNKKDVIIDRFDKANFKALTKGDWFTFTDKAGGGQSSITTHYKKDDTKNQYFEFDYKLKQGRWQWTPYATLACNVSGKEIPSGIQAIAYEFKGNEHSFIYRTDNIKDYAYYQKVIPTSKEWTTVIIPLTALNQPNWGKKVGFSSIELSALSWQINGQSNDSGKVAIDNVRLLYTPQHIINKSPEENKISIGHSELFHSNLLNEDRGLSIYLPLPLSELRASNKSYPVIYLLDGDSHIKTLGSMVQNLSPEYGNTVLPEMIIIGINNTDRWRDLSPSHIDKSPFGHKTDRLKTTGGGEKFMDFIEKELIPHVDSIYPTAPYKILIGHSLGGLTTINTLIHRPHLFNAYLAIDPSLWWNDQLLNKQAASALDKMNLDNKQLFIATANTMYPGVDTKKIMSDTSADAIHMKSVFSFTEILKKHPSCNLRWKNVYYENDDHTSVPFIADYDGLRYFFDYNRITFTGKFDDPDFDIDSALTNHFQLISHKMGYEIKPAEDVINRMGYYYFNGNKNSKQALAFFLLNAKNYPNSANVYDSLGEYYETKGDNVKAIEYYKKALSIKEWDYVRKKLERLESTK